MRIFPSFAARSERRRTARRSAWLAIVLCFVTVASLGRESDQTLRVTWRDAIPNVDPYYNTLRTGMILTQHVWDGLLYRDPYTFEIKPLLARSYVWRDPTTLEFELRSDVTFHNGDAFTAADVVYTINTVVRDRRVARPSTYSFLAGADEIDEHRVRVRLTRPFPGALEYIALVLPIWPSQYRQRVGAEGYAKHPIGTGPYRITRLDGIRQIDLERFDRYYHGSPKGRAAIRRVLIRQVPDAASEITDLLGGRTDWIWMFNPDLYRDLSEQPELEVKRQESMRVGYLSLDAAGRTGADNPMTDVRVRRAIFHAIDRASMAKYLIGAGSRVIDAPCYPSQFGCDASAAQRYEYDPQRSRQLLREAGYPHGFETELISSILPHWGEAVQAYLKAVGIDAKVRQLQIGAAMQSSIEGRNPLTLGDWGSGSINDVAAILPYYFAGGGDDYTRDPAVRALLEAGGTSIDPTIRQAKYSEAIRMITDKAYWLPLYTYVTTYAFAKELNFTPSKDDLPRFYLASWRHREPEKNGSLGHLNRSQ